MQPTSVKDVGNKVCGISGCDNRSERRLVTILGFAAWFCNPCADGLIKDGLAQEGS